MQSIPPGAPLAQRSLPPVLSSEGYKGFNNLPPEYKERIKVDSALLKNSKIDPKVFFVDPVLPEFPAQLNDIFGENGLLINENLPEQLIQFLKGLDTYLEVIAFHIVDFRKNNPSRAYVFLSILIGKIKQYPKDLNCVIQSRLPYLRILAETIAAGTHATQYTSVGKIAQDAVSLLGNTTPLLRAVSVLDDDQSTNIGALYPGISTKPELFALLRRTILNVSVNLCDLYIATGEQSQLHRTIRSAGMIASTLYSAQIQYDLILTEIGVYIERSGVPKQTIIDLLDNATKGLEYLKTVYVGEHMHYYKIAKHRLELYKSLYVAKSSNLERIDQCAEVVASIQRVSASSELSDAENALLSRIEVMLLKAIHRNGVTLKGLEAKKLTIRDSIAKLDGKSVEKGEDLQRQLRRIDGLESWLQKLLEDEGKLFIHTHKGVRNIKIFLTPLIEYLSYLIQKYKLIKGNDRMKMSIDIQDLIIEIYTIAVSGGMNREDKNIILRLPLFESFVDLVRDFFDISGDSDARVETTESIVHRIENLKSQQDQRIREDMDKSTTLFMGMFGGEIHSLEIATITPAAQVLSYKFINPKSDIHQESSPDYNKCQVGHTYGGKKYTLSIIYKRGELDEEYRFQIMQYLNQYLMSHLERYFANQEWKSQVSQISIAFHAGIEYLNRIEAVTSNAGQTLFDTSELSGLTVHSAKGVMREVALSIFHTLQVNEALKAEFYNGVTTLSGASK